MLSMILKYKQNKTKHLSCIKTNTLLYYPTPSQTVGSFFFFFNKFIYLFLAVLGLLLHVGFSLVAANRGYSWLQ